MTDHFKTIRDALDTLADLGVPGVKQQRHDALLVLSQLKKEREELVESLFNVDELAKAKGIYKGYSVTRDVAKALLEKLRDGK